MAWVGYQGVKLIVGLGNPGIEYELTPHNLGFLAVDRIAAQCGVELRNRQCRALTARAEIAGEPVLLAKPETYMNLSGMSVRELVEEYEAVPAKDLIVIYDELDLPLGAIRIRKQGSSAGHKGIQSILAALGSQEVPRIRLGVAPEHEVGDGARYVLGPFRKAQYPLIDEILETAAKAARTILTDGVDAAMNQYNRRPAPPEGNETDGS